MLEATEDTPTDTEVTEADSCTSLEQMISLLQGGQGAALADPGLTRLDPEQLDSLRRHASYQAALCLERATQLLRLMLYSVEYRQKLQPDDLAISSTHVTMLVEERQRWMTLAENAQYYQQHPDVAAKISHYLT
jgi:hypothetical protein